MLYVDIPTTADITALSSARDDISVSIYLPTTPVSLETQASRIELKNLAKEAVRQLQSAQADKRRVAALTEQLDDLVDDDEFWRFQARSLAVLATPENLRSFRMASALQPMVAVSDRFHLKPLLRAASFPNSCYVLALAEGSVRLVEVSADLPPATIEVADLPENAGRAVRRASIDDRSPRGRLQAGEGEKVLLRQYARQVDKALRTRLAGKNIPLILAATEPLAPIYRSVNSYVGLAATGIGGSPESMSDSQLAESARKVLDTLYRAEIAAWRELFKLRESQARASTDIAQVARAATFGAVESMLVDIDEVVPGHIDETDGSVSFDNTDDAINYGVVDEIAARVIAAGGRVIGVRRADIPRQASLAVVLRYPA